MRDEQHWYRQLDGNPQHKRYVSTTPLPGVLDTIHQVSQVSKVAQQRDVLVTNLQVAQQWDVLATNLHVAQQRDVPATNL